MDIHNSNYGYPLLGIMDTHKCHSFMDIHNSIMDIHNWIMDIQNWFMDINNWLWISIIKLWISIIRLWISMISRLMDIHNSICGYPQFDLWISITRFMDIHNSIYGYPWFDLWISTIIIDALVPTSLTTTVEWLWRHTYWLRSWHQIHILMNIHNSELWISNIMDIHNSELWISINSNYGCP